ncbi:hypothetical protein ACU8KH_01046 [Lachancea thermotolerans]
MYSIFEAKHNPIYQNNGSKAGGIFNTNVYAQYQSFEDEANVTKSISMPVQKGIDFATKLSIDLSLWQTSIRVLGHSLLIEISTAGPRAPWHADLSSRHQESKFEQKTVKPKEDSSFVASQRADTFALAADPHVFTGGLSICKKIAIAKNL